ncbi:RNA polymerase, sigma-24 subunit, ECF subfamily [Niastella koreensis GR20-10]|uniref:RNA polymerase, sigma-24 subunit, ECF subfamily n=1 Tax=Niastella koreensis (strain DSM 17620 / KACC 11465 / NBRC 106392 / GR20-10) TaxID=700598 RepID=G8TRM9_NIAKG|nr:sigma-70 family RNA polymerase sigma factor [Niastella koreensis]AEW02176.1 RNA polymerase, sigma-24 subunit, ECF subfamily [Niastella koreensis GR20-10]
MLHPLKDTGILAAIAQHDERAFNSLFVEYHQQMGHFVFSVTRSKELTEEIIQDVFVKLWENRLQLPSIKNFPAYLFIITRNHTLNAIRKQVQIKEKEAAIAEHYELSTEKEPVAEDNLYAILDSAVDQLPLQQKKVYLLRQQGLKNADVAYRLDLSVNSVKKYQQWATQTIVKLIKAGPFTGIVFLFSTFF